MHRFRSHPWRTSAIGAVLGLLLAALPVAAVNYSTSHPGNTLISGVLYVKNTLTAAGGLIITTLTGANGETIDNATDDMWEFQGVGGTDNTDLRLDLDGTYPVFDSPTDTMIGFGEAVDVVGAFTVGGGYGATGCTVSTAGAISCDDAAIFGGGYGATGCTLSAAGVVDCNGAITSDGAITGLSGVFGGGYGSTGATISSAGVGQFNGALTTDGNFVALSGDFGGGYGVTGCTITADGVVRCDDGFVFLAASTFGNAPTDVMLFDTSTPGDGLFTDSPILRLRVKHDPAGVGAEATADCDVFVDATDDAGARNFVIDCGGGSDEFSLTSTGALTVASDLTITGDDLFMTTNTLGAVLVGDGTNFNPVVIGSDIAIAANGDATVQANAVALGTDTTNNYVESVSTSALTGLTGGVAAAEGTTPSLAFDYSATLAGDPQIAGNGTVFASTGILFEGATGGAGNAFEALLTVTDPTADNTFTFPDASGEVSLLGQTIASGEIVDGTIACGDTDDGAGADGVACEDGALSWTGIQSWSAAVTFNGGVTAGNAAADTVLLETASPGDGLFSDSSSVTMRIRHDPVGAGAEATADCVLFYDATSDAGAGNVVIDCGGGADEFSLTNAGVLTLPGGVVSTLSQTIDDTEMTAEDFGHFSCSGLEDGCTVDADALDFTELSDAMSLDTSTTIAEGAGETLAFNKTASDGVADPALTINYTALDTGAPGDLQAVFGIVNLASTEAADAMVFIDNADADDAASGIVMQNSGGGGWVSYFTAPNFQISGNGAFGGNSSGEFLHAGTGADAEFGFYRNNDGMVTLKCYDNDGTGAADCTLDTAGAGSMYYGSADVLAHTWYTDSTGDAEIVLPLESIGAGEIVNPTREINLPMGSWYNCTASELVTWAAGADTKPGFVLVNSAGPVIAYDDTGGSIDSDEICTTWTMPADYASGGTLALRVTQDGATGVNIEDIACRVSKDGAVLGGAVTVPLANQTAAQSASLAGLDATWTAGQAISVLCKQSDAAADDTVYIHAAAFSYTATQ